MKCMTCTHYDVCHSRIEHDAGNSAFSTLKGCEKYKDKQWDVPIVPGDALFLTEYRGKTISKVLHTHAELVCIHKDPLDSYAYVSVKNKKMSFLLRISAIGKHAFRTQAEAERALNRGSDTEQRGERE